MTCQLILPGQLLKVKGSPVASEPVTWAAMWYDIDGVGERGRIIGVPADQWINSDCLILSLSSCHQLLDVILVCVLTHAGYVGYINIERLEKC